MLSSTTAAPRATARADGSTPSRRAPFQGLLTTVVPALVLLLFFSALRPVGYHGGEWDDWHYLEAARCAAANGICVPSSHWWTRWPLVAPMGGTLWLFGETRSVLWIVPAAYAAAATMLFALLVERQFGRSAARLASIALAATPVFNERVLNPNADIPELTWILAGLLALQSAFRSGKRIWAVAAGCLVALAIATRPTAVTLTPIAILVLLIASPKSRRLAWPFTASAVAALAIQMGVYWAWAGDALLDWRLSLRHTTIPSVELAPGVDLSRSPLFNIAYIDGWRPAAGIKLYWTIDPILNLFAHTAIGPTLALAIALLLLRHRELPSQTKRLLFVLLGLAALHFGALAYALAVDPKPRMFLFEVATAAALIGVCGTKPAGRPAVTPLAGIGVALLVLTSITFQLEAPDRLLPPMEQEAGRWVADHKGALATDDMTRRLLALAPGVDRLPFGGEQQRSADVLFISPGGCSANGQPFAPTGWRTLRHYAVAPGAYPVTAWLRRHNLLRSPTETPTLCLMHHR